MTARFIPVEPFDLVVFGGTGDLAMRKLLPGLYHRDSDGQLPAESRIIGAARSELTREAYLAQVEAALAPVRGRGRSTRRCCSGSSAGVDYVQVDARAPSGWGELAARLGEAPGRVRVCYLATVARPVRPDLPQRSPRPSW